MRSSTARFVADVLVAGLAAAILGGIPSTVAALAFGGDVLEPTRAVGTMVMPADSPVSHLLLAAAFVHPAISLFWTSILAVLLPRRGTAWAGLVAGAAIGVLDLKLIAPLAFPEIAALPFGPQLADHLAWGACVGAVLAWRRRR